MLPSDRLLHEKAIDRPLTISSSEIQERSNLHPALVLIALLQVTWFITQCLSCVKDSIFARKKTLDAQSPILIRPASLDLPTARNRDRLQTPPGVNKDFKREENLLGSQIRECTFQLECPPIIRLQICQWTLAHASRSRFCPSLAFPKYL